MKDLLNMELLNSLPQPLRVSETGKAGWWPIQDFCVKTGIVRIDVFGVLQSTHFSDWNYIRDDSQQIHSLDDFYLEDSHDQ